MEGEKIIHVPKYVMAFILSERKKFESYSDFCYKAHEIYVGHSYDSFSVEKTKKAIHYCKLCTMILNQKMKKLSFELNYELNFDDELWHSESSYLSFIFTFYCCISRNFELSSIIEQFESDIDNFFNPKHDDPIPQLYPMQLPSFLKTETEI